MNKRLLYRILEWIIALAACFFLVWKLATYEDYEALWDCLRAMDARRWLALGVCVALMPVNMTLEAWRWKTLIPMTWREAHRQVYYSKLAGLITPWRLGEYPARAVLMSDDRPDDPVWSQTLSMGAVGSATMTAAIVLAGLLGIAFSPYVLACLGDSYLYALLAVVLLLAALFMLMPRMLRRWAVVNNELLIHSTGQSLVRLFCWCVQLYLVLFSLGAIINHQSSIINIPVYYLLVTVTPNVPVVEAGVRGAWAIFVFGSMNAGLAGVLLWGINTLMPCLIWPFLRKK